MKYPILRNEPTIVEFRTLGMGVNGPVPETHEVRIMRIYAPQSVFPTEQTFLSCDCPRAVRPTRECVVWHSPECPEAERDA